MNEGPQSSRNQWWRPWIAVMAGVVTHIGVAALLVGAVIVVGRVLAVHGELPESNWTTRMNRADSFAWYVLQTISLVSGLAAGAVAVWLSPARSQMVSAVLLLLAVASVFFAELPQPRSVAIIAIWAAATPIGIVLGACLSRRRKNVA